jgi:hypothetical protein
MPQDHGSPRPRIMAPLDTEDEVMLQQIAPPTPNINSARGYDADERG